MGWTQVCLGLSFDICCIVGFNGTCTCAWEQQAVGWGEGYHSDMQFHSWIMLSNRVQADTFRVRVGACQQGHGKQPSRLSSHPLRAGADASQRQVLRLLHGKNNPYRSSKFTIQIFFCHVSSSSSSVQTRYRIVVHGTITSWVWSIRLVWGTEWSWERHESTTMRITGRLTSLSSATWRKVTLWRAIARIHSLKILSYVFLSVCLMFLLSPRTKFFFVCVFT